METLLTAQQRQAAGMAREIVVLSRQRASRQGCNAGEGGTKDDPVGKL